MKNALSLLIVFVFGTAVAAENEAEKSVANEAPAVATENKKPLAEGPLSMSVTGTQDAPNVLYIVPWKTVDAVPEDAYVSSLLDEVFAPVDPVEFERGIRINQQIRAHAADGNAVKE